jgi:hypothetical protein
MRRVEYATIKPGPKHPPWCAGMDVRLLDGQTYEVLGRTPGGSLMVTTGQYSDLCGTEWYAVDPDDVVLSSGLELGGDYLHAEYTIDALGIA